MVDSPMEALLKARAERNKITNVFAPRNAVQPDYFTNLAKMIEQKRSDQQRKTVLEGLLRKKAQQRDGLLSEVNKSEQNAMNASINSAVKQGGSIAQRQNSQTAVQSLVGQLTGAAPKKTSFLDNLIRVGSGMGATPGVSFASDFIGSSQRDQAAQAAAEQARANRAIKEADLADKLAYRTRGENRDDRREDRVDSELALKKEVADRNALPKPSAINKPNIKAMEDVIDSLGLNYESLYDSWFNFMAKDDKPNKETAKTALATTALDLQRADPSLIGKTRETLEMAIAILSAEKEKKSAAPVNTGTDASYKPIGSINSKVGN